jgi:holo-[acyl-carrier protein] synthase
MIIGIGIDSIELDRIQGVYENFPQRFLQRIYAESEQAYFKRWADPIPRLAGRFAVKEACMKALGTGWSSGVRWRDIEVGRHPSGKPELILHGRAREIFEKMGGESALCTITHSRDHAMAVVIFEAKDR